MFESLNLTINGVKTHFLKGGSGPDLLYLHGAGGGGGWLPHHEMLAEYFTVYAPDHPGWGESEGPEWMDSMQDYVLHYDSLLRDLNIDHPVIVGHSLGGWMAAEFACTYPTGINALILVNAAGYPYDNETPELDNQPNFFAAASRGGPEFAKLLFHDQNLAAAYFAIEPTPEDTLRRYRALTSTARITWHIWFEPKLPRRLSRVTAPALILWGRHDGVFPPSVGLRYAESIPGSRLIILENCAHMIPIEDPLALCKSVLDLYKEAQQ